LLTFFFRQMPELIERGYIYIAQPPLYKIKKGKFEQYLKDEHALEAYLTNSALDEAAIHVNEEAPPIQGEGLEKLVEEYRAVFHRVERLSRLYPRHILEQLIYVPAVREALLSDHAGMKAWATEFEARLGAGCPPSERYMVGLREDAERQIFLPHVTQVTHGVAHDYTLNREFVLSNDYRAIMELGEKIRDLLGEGAYARRGDKVRAVSTFRAALEWLMDESRKGHSIQRYKGLGEMNPEQLWETTMDPAVRRMLRVTVEDAIAADQIFTTLMGDAVEPRRDFIESNALNVSNLDV
jgi:DNA gyrase subunit B